MERAQEPGNGLLFYRARKLPGKFTGASRNALSGPVKLPDKLTGPEVTGTFEKRAPGKFTSAQKTKHFIGVFMTAVDRIKCRYAHSGMTSGVGGFQNPAVCLQAFPSFLPHPLPAYSRHFFTRSLPRNSTETLATLAKTNQSQTACSAYEK